jgi:hypothetical protein
VAEIVVTIHGPLLTGAGPGHVVRDILDEATWQVGAQGLADVHRILDQRIRHPTPYYETQVTMERAARDVVVHDRGVVYGPWLEGVSSRNQSTRFKGYHAFRTACQELEAKVPALVEPIVNRHLAALR